jgi:hypothetical protein
MIILQPWEDIRTEVWAMFDYFEVKGKIPPLEEKCVQECFFCYDCCTGGCGQGFCMYCNRKEPKHD